MEKVEVVWFYYVLQSITSTTAVLPQFCNKLLVLTDALQGEQHIAQKMENRNPSTQVITMYRIYIYKCTCKHSFANSFYRLRPIIKNWQVATMPRLVLQLQFIFSRSSFAGNVLLIRIKLQDLKGLSTGLDRFSSKPSNHRNKRVHSLTGIHHKRSKTV